LIKEAILCVDDEAVILLAMRQELRRRYTGRFLIETAVDSRTAAIRIEDLEAKGISTALIISDWFMPGVRGDQFLVEVHERRPDIKMILITGHAELESVDRARREAGLFACLQKPWRAADLFAVIDDCLASRSGG
jgi:DNA-binding NtrC family response regulator